jgi:hypothetical protein
MEIGALSIYVGYNLSLQFHSYITSIAMPAPARVREGDIPGTVDLSVIEGEDTGASYGQALYPVPTDDPNDPLNVCRLILLVYYKR